MRKFRERRLIIGRAAYRRQRMLDATRILPMLLALAFLLPPVWHPAMFSFATGTLWLGGSWLVTIILTAVLHQQIGNEDEDDDAA